MAIAAFEPRATGGVNSAGNRGRIDPLLLGRRPAGSHCRLTVSCRSPEAGLDRHNPNDDIKAQHDQTEAS
jgi:hypothetical protein